MLTDYSNRIIEGNMFFPNISQGKIISIGDDNELIGIDPPENVAGGNTWAIANEDMQLAVNTNYVVTGTIKRLLLLPAIAELGENILILGECNWRIVQNADDVIRFGNKVTVAGNSGYLESTETGDCIGLVCVDEKKWMVYPAPQGVIIGMFQ